MTDQVGLTGGRKLFACLAHYLLKDSFNMNKIIYLSLIASMEDTILNLDYTKMGPKSITQGDANQAHLLSRITTEGHNSAPIPCFMVELRKYGTQKTLKKSYGHRALKEPGLHSKGPNPLLDLHMGILK